MATVQLADIYNPLTFAAGVNEAQLELNKFIGSGVMVRDEGLSEKFGQGGHLTEVTGYNPLGTQEPNYSNDDPDAKSTPKNIDSAKMKLRLAAQNQSWSTMNLSRELALADPMAAIETKIGQYWATQNERRVLKSCLGVLADNVANDSGSMVHNIASDSADAVTDAERIGGDAYLEAEQTLGDHMGSIGAIGMHSRIYTRLRKQQLIDFIPPARGEVQIPTYMGKPVIYDDSFPAVAGSNRITYTCILFGMGAFVNADGNVLEPSDYEKIPSAGNGGGQEIIYSRRSDLIHPLGFSFLSGAVAGQSATQAELASAANWKRVWDRKHIPLAFLQVND